MDNEKAPLWYNTVWNILASGMQYTGIYFGVATMIANLNDAINHYQRINAGNLIDGPYKSTALLGGLFFVAGCLIKHYVRRGEAAANSSRLEESIKSELDLGRRQIAHMLEDKTTQGIIDSPPVRKRDYLEQR